MTTTTLLTHTLGPLNEHDFQALRDFALEAPWEWRTAFEQLLELAKHGQESEAIEETITDLEVQQAEWHKALLTANMDVLKFMEQIETKARENKLTKGDVDTLCSGVREAMNILTAAVGDGD